MSAQPGWYHDPSGRPGMLRFFDGTAWTEHLRPAPQQPGPQQPGPGAPHPPTARSAAWGPAAQAPVPPATAPQQVAGATQWAPAPDPAAGRRPRRTLPPWWRWAAAAALVLALAAGAVRLWPSSSGASRADAVSALLDASATLTETQAGCIVDRLHGEGVPYGDLVSRRTPTPAQTVQRTRAVAACTAPGG